MADVIVNDEYIQSIGPFMEQQGQKFDEWYSAYIGIMREIKVNVIKEGQVAQSLEDFIQMAEKMKEEMGALLKNAHQLTDGFLGSVDAADQFLY